VLFDLAAAFIGGPPACRQHDEIGAAAEGLGKIAGQVQPPSEQISAQAMRGVAAFDDRRELRITPRRRCGCCTPSRPMPTLTMSRQENQLFGHLACERCAMMVTWDRPVGNLG